MIDFGISDYFLDRKTGKHIKIEEEDALIGTMRYASINSHKRLKLSRRDDLESLVYLMVHFSRDGGLPWHPKDGEISVMNKKKSVKDQELFKGLPP